MKRIILAVVLSLVAAAVIWGATAAPEPNSDCERVADTVTVDSQATSTMWELLDSVIILKTDTCYTIHTISGHAILDPGDRLYIGFIDGGGAPSATTEPVDTFVFYGDEGQRSTQYVAFTATYLDSLISQTDASDTIYFMAAAGGSGPGEKVMLRNVIRMSLVIDNN